MATFRHLIANSTFIMPDGKVIVFAGGQGLAGSYTTEDEKEINELRKVAKMPTTQLEELVATKDGELEVAAGKHVDPAVAQAVSDAAESAVRAADPELTAKTVDLGKLIAAAKSN